MFILIAELTSVTISDSLEKETERLTSSHDYFFHDEKADQ